MRSCAQHLYGRECSAGAGAAVRDESACAPKMRATAMAKEKRVPLYSGVRQ